MAGKGSLRGKKASQSASQSAAPHRQLAISDTRTQVGGHNSRSIGRRGQLHENECMPCRRLEVSCHVHASPDSEQGGAPTAAVRRAGRIDEARGHHLLAGEQAGRWAGLLISPWPTSPCLAKVHPSTGCISNPRTGSHVSYGSQYSGSACCRARAASHGE